MKATQFDIIEAFGDAWPLYNFCRFSHPLSHISPQCARIPGTKHICTYVRLRWVVIVYYHYYYLIATESMHPCRWSSMCALEWIEIYGIKCGRRHMRLRLFFFFFLHLSFCSFACSLADILCNIAHRGAHRASGSIALHCMSFGAVCVCRWYWWCIIASCNKCTNDNKFATDIGFSSIAFVRIYPIYAPNVRVYSHKPIWRTRIGVRLHMNCKPTLW